MEPDPIQAALAEVAGVPLGQPGNPHVGEVVGKPKSYPSPTKYEGHKWATKINAMLDKLDQADDGSLLSKPAETVMVGECAMATGEAFGLTGGDGDNVPIHPAWLLLCAVVAFAAIIAVQHWMKPKGPAAPRETPAEREARIASLA